MERLDFPHPRSSYVMLSHKIVLHQFHQVVKMKKWLFLGIALYSTQLAAFPRANPVPGGVAVLPVAPLSDKPPIVQYAGKRVTVVPQGDQWQALIGLPLDAEPGTQRLLVSGRPLEFEIKNKQYRTQRIRITDPNKVTPDEESSERIVRELNIQKQVRSRFSSTTQPDLNFIRPVPGRDTGSFGLRRIINELPRNPHSGMDIAAPTGTPVKATAAGRVIHVGDFFFSGNSVYVDHGSGVISLYAHLSQTRVKPGDTLLQGDVLGEVGRTGRATGPHLHWSIYLNGEAVDPALFL